MSAFVVGKPHIDALVRVGVEGPSGRAVSPDNAWHTLRWFTVSDEDVRSLPWQEVESVTRRLDYTNADEVGAMLWGENVRSIQYRYPDTIEEPGNMPGPLDFTPAEVLIYRYTRTQAPRLTAVETLSALNCYEYQSCEHPEWVTSEARRYCDALRRAVIHALPGYREAAWEVSV